MSARGDQLNWPFAALWASAALALWLISCSIHPWGAGWFAPLVVIACAAQVITVTYRLPGWKTLRITRNWTSAYWPEVTSPIDDQLTWLLAWTSQIYVLAAVVQLTTSLWSGWFGLAVGSLVELWLWRYAPIAWRQAIQRLVPQLLPTAHFDTCSDSDQESTEQAIRSQSHVESPGGESYQTGWAVVSLAQDQKVAHVTFVFSPPFITPPEVELDYESIDEEIDVELTNEHITPAGMRISLKRKNAANDQQLKILWHAVASEASEVRRLP